MHYASYDLNSGKIIGLYDDNINTNIPEDAVQITDNEWENFLSNQRHWKIDVNSKTMVYIENPEMELPLEYFIEMKKREIKVFTQAEIDKGVQTPFGFKVKCDLDDIMMFRGGIEFEIAKAIAESRLEVSESEAEYATNGIILPTVYIKPETDNLPIEIKTLDSGKVMSTISRAKDIVRMQLSKYNEIYRRKWLKEEEISNLINQYNNNELTLDEVKLAIRNITW